MKQSFDIFFTIFFSLANKKANCTNLMIAQIIFVKNKDNNIKKLLFKVYLFTFSFAYLFFLIIISYLFKCIMEATS
jgi:hypothetical protein